ncbi:transcription factor CP2 isoform X4 [Amyelois transitella]|uniref:transcription factor CP2 isoform X3 n=1 Tax=Amyelois transitella TaxID=680683 RepID=UPI00067B6D19|nr:transcription factor CP2 isoform X3 [Amyelois transitella]XP_013188280.1 transcription factor CP2 isoform X3 [Amyelois transitella]XP_060808554.1 transcription factor CP2 isoform X4 [Amyelois transitella]
MVEDTSQHNGQNDRVSAAAVLQFAAREAREGRRFAEFGAQAFASITYNAYASLGDMGGSGTSSASSHLSPGWHVSELDLDLPGELTMNDALLSSLAVFKQEAPSPTGNVVSPPRRVWPRRDDRQITSMVVDGSEREVMDDGCQQSPPHAMMNQHAGSPEGMQCQQMAQNTLVPMNGYHSPVQENKNAGLLMCSPVSSLDGFLHSPAARSEPSFKDDTRFQYVLAAATSIATKQNEETLTYLNQGQPYEIKLKKLGDLSHYKGKILKSVIKICFHERRLQYMEREQISQWHAERPGERIVEVDVPLSYGVIRVEQPSCLNSLHVYWDPTKDVGVYIKVNCISTEFTAKKHGGEKGVPFRIQVETYLASDEHTRLHAAACQIKVFKLKGADRKHKQDREKVLRRPRAELEKYQPGCESTVLTTLSNDAMMPPPSLVTTSPPYSPEMCVTPKSVTSPHVVNSKPVLPQPTVLASNNQMKPLYCQDGGEMKVNSPQCHSPGAILPDLPQAAEDPDKNSGLSKEASSIETQSWLSRHRFSQHAATLANFSGADLLRLSREDIIQICGLADGIRLFNALHAKRIEPRLTVYVCPAGGAVYSALYLHSCRAGELLHKLRALHDTRKECETVLVSGPNGTRVRLTDELVRHLPDNSTYRLEAIEDSKALLLSATNCQNAV